jgi:3-hydroxyisobutyrate dehydrogenase-like beta-hydroxyacid dehydrogenase
MIVRTASAGWNSIARTKSEEGLMKIGFLGLGQMGTPMAMRLLAAGHELSVWNRTEARADPLLREGAVLAGTPAEAELGAEAVITMLFDDAANERVVFGDNGLMDSLSPGVIHISCSTISVELSQRLTVEHARHGHRFVAAPVFGRPNIAEAGRLWVVAAGAEEVIERVRPLFEAISRGVSIVGREPPLAHAVKLGGNFLISAMIHSLSESFVYAEGQGIAPELFMETVNNALFQSPFYAAYGKVMLNPPEHPGATIELGAKDLGLLRQAAAARGTRLSLADAMAEIFTKAQQAGLGSEDWAVGQYRMAQRRGSTLG